MTSWRKSSYSSNNGGDCVEVGAWLKSSHSGPNGGDCLEWAPARIPTGAVPIRDSKTAPHGPALLVPAAAWRTFVTAISDHRLPL
ncbi:DUF397 domain-containing protein [Streptoverticillium reticulum]|uniref:DUF397 domain-containing protein n=1 Tax=Streptoverticillium reticulum TaxID=1433415 RepID=UPI0039BF105A